MGHEPLRIVLLGPPGAGKGTLGTRLADHYGLLHISTGDMLREAVTRGSELGARAREFMDRGDLVPDEVILEIVEEIMPKAIASGYIADGFPRTLAQAQRAFAIANSHEGNLHAAVNLVAGDEELVRRMRHRVATSEHVRADDTEQTFRHRLEVFRDQTAPLLDYYAGRGVRVDVDAGRAPEDIFRDVVTRLDAVPR